MAVLGNDFLSRLPISISKDEAPEVQGGLQFFINYINILEGVKSKIKNLHWAATKLPNSDKRGAHLYLDDYLDTVGEFQDNVAEDAMSILGIMPVDCIQGVGFPATNTADLISYVLEKTTDFYNNTPAGAIYKGLTSETEQFIHESNVTKYRFNLTE